MPSPPHREQNHHDHQRDRADLEEPRHRHQDLRRQRQLAAQAREHPREHRDDEQQHPDDRQDRDDEHHDRVGHRGLDLPAQLHLGLEVGRDRQQHLIEEPADLAGLDHVDHERREDPRVLRQPGRERDTGLDVGPHLSKHLCERLALGLLREDRQRPEQREPRVDHGRELARHDRHVLEADLVGEPGDRDLLAEAPGVHLVDRERREAHRLEAVRHRGLVDRLDPALDELPAPVTDRVLERLALGHHSAPFE